MAKVILLTALLSFFLATSYSAKVHELCVGDPDCEDNTFCSNGHCLCQSGSLVFDGQCVKASGHGEQCVDHFHCTEDPNLQCVEQSCQCGKGFEYDGAVCKEQTNQQGEKATRPPHIKLNKMAPKDTRNEVIEVDTKLEDDFNEDTSLHKPLYESKLFGPISIVCAIVLVFAICMCFWSVRIPEYREDAYVTDTSEQHFNGEYTRGKSLEDGLPTTIVMGNGLDGQDNPCYQNDNERQFQQQINDNMDALSHFTTQTEVCDANHQDYIQKQRRDEEIRAMTCNGEDKRAEMIMQQGPPPGVKMIFKHSQQISLTPSMDEADVEVAGIYKTYSTENPLSARMDTLATPNNNASSNDVKAKRPHRIELVETPDCTSIDTTIPEEEIAQYQRGLERRKELDINGSIKEEDETEDDIEEPEFENSDDTLDTPRLKECSDYIDNVFKPVFSIS